jgi:tetratricopeptide (TPR) repeat protein
VAASDELFNKFVSLSDLGADSRFNWEGSKLLAQYYLDTGRLEMGKAMAITALRQVVDGQAGKQMTRSRHPDTYVALFERFDGVETMLDYLRERRKDFPDSIFLSLMEEAALVSLGRAQEAVEASQRAHPRESAVGRKVLLGELYAKMGRFEEAARHYEMAIAADAQAPHAAYLTLAGLYARLDRMQDAERLLSDAAERFGSSMWFSAGGFFAGQGDAVRASRAYRMLDDLGARVDAKAFGEAARFLAANGEAEPMADMLARRLTVQESFEAKAEYVVECMPWESAAAPKYMIVGERLAEGRLSYDHALLAFFYRALSERSAMLLDAATAVSAASKAVEHEGDNPQSLANLVAVTAGRPSEAAARAALAAHAKVPSAAALLALAEAELALGRAESGCGRLAAAFSAPLTSGETARALRLTTRHGLERPLLGKLPFGPAPGRPWQMHALLAEAAAAGASEATAASESRLATEGGDYIGRALWAAELYLNAGAGDRAREVMDARKACGEHPAVALFDVEAARRAGDAAAALDAATAACRTYSRPPAQAVFAAEVARLKAGE